LPNQLDTSDGTALLLESSQVILTEVDGQRLYRSVPAAPDLFGIGFIIMQPREEIGPSVKWRREVLGLRRRLVMHLELLPGSHTVRLRLRDAKYTPRCSLQFEAAKARQYVFIVNRDTARLQDRESKMLAGVADCTNTWSSREDIATLRHHGDAWIEAIDGWSPYLAGNAPNLYEDGPPGIQWSRWGLEMKPGPYTVLVNYRTASANSMSPCALRFSAAAGRAYVVHAKGIRTEGRLLPGPVINWDARIEDARTKEVAAKCP
jgi:hypothetical protein